MAKTPPNSGKQWTSADKQTLAKGIGGNKPTRLIARDLGRSVDAVYSKASELDRSLKPTNQRPYGPRRKEK